MPSQKCQILLVDDYVPIREELRQLLSPQPDFEVIGEANDGKEAISFVADFRPDVILLDLNMPNMNGIEAAKVINKSWPEIVILGLCEVKDAYIVEVFLKSGAVAVLTKDSIDQVIGTIRRACPQKTMSPTL